MMTIRSFLWRIKKRITNIRRSRAADERFLQIFWPCYYWRKKNCRNFWTISDFI